MLQACLSDVGVCANPTPPRGRDTGGGSRAVVLGTPVDPLLPRRTNAVVEPPVAPAVDRLERDQAEGVGRAGALAHVATRQTRARPQPEARSPAAAAHAQLERDVTRVA